MFKSSFLLVPCCTLISLTSWAELNVNLGATSHYVREGIGQTRGNPTLQTGLTFKHSSGFYAGLWASGMDHRTDDLFLEADGFAGLYLPLTEHFALDFSATDYRFFGDDDAVMQDYQELGLSVLLYDNVKLGYRYAEDYQGKGSDWQALSTSYTMHTQGFDLEFYAANYRWLDADGRVGASYSAGDRQDYWHFRIGAERTWKKWDYRLSVERTNLNSSYDAGTLFQFSLQRHFNLW